MYVLQHRYLEYPGTDKHSTVTVINIQLSTVNGQPTTVNYQPAY